MKTRSRKFPQSLIDGSIVGATPASPLRKTDKEGDAGIAPTYKLPAIFATRCLALLLLLLIGAGCQISPAQELQIGRESHPKFEAEFGGIYPDEQVQRYVQAIGSDLAKYAGRPDMDWQFRVLNSKDINAFAVPGGYIYITQGLLFKMNNEAQLAGVLAHEAAHVARRHSARQIQQTMATQFGVSLVGIFGGADIGNAAGLVAGLGLMKYSRDQERESDMYGLKYMTQVGYNPTAMVETMKILEQAAQGNSPPEFLSTHPNPGNRIEYLNETIDQQYPAIKQSGFYSEDAFRRIVLDRKAGTG